MLDLDLCYKTGLHSLCLWQELGKFGAQDLSEGGNFVVIPPRSDPL